MRCRDRRAKALFHFRFKKHTSRKRRKSVGKMLDSLIEKYSAQIHEVVQEAQVHAIIHGQSGVKVSWNTETNEPKFEVTDGHEAEV